MEHTNSSLKSKEEPTMEQSNQNLQTICEELERKLVAHLNGYMYSCPNCNTPINGDKRFTNDPYSFCECCNSLVETSISKRIPFSDILAKCIVIEYRAFSDTNFKSVLIRVPHKRIIGIDTQSRTIILDDDEKYTYSIISGDLIQAVNDYYKKVFQNGGVRNGQTFGSGRGREGAV